MKQREIKFRAFNGEQMISPDYIDRNGVAWWKEDSIPTFNVQPMQFTGLTDKNGVDIYEGDIVKFHYFYMSFGANMGAQESEHELIGVVKWQEYGYGLDAIKGEHWAGYTGYSDGEGYSDFLHLAGMSESSVHEESFEIIGNIYEHPELLTTKK